MEFPYLGSHCSFSDCRRLDFLPIKCNACGKEFCKEHFQYASHSCPGSYKKDRLVLSCPLCSRPIPPDQLRGESPDEAVSRHIDTDCTSDPARKHRGQIFKNRCNFAGCKKRELVPITCPRCTKTYCLRHRIESDHKCNGKFSPAATAPQVAARQAALTRLEASKKAAIPQPTSQPVVPITSSASCAPPVAQPPARPSVTYVRTANLLPDGISEEEAIAMAMSLSLAEGNGTATGTNAASANDLTHADEELARAMQQSERERARAEELQRAAQRTAHATT